jgi:hypothetical protein
MSLRTANCLHCGAKGYYCPLCEQWHHDPDAPQPAEHFPHVFSPDPLNPANWGGTTESRT